MVREGDREKHLKNLIAFSILLFVLSGVTSSFLDQNSGIAHLMFAISAFFSIIGFSLLASKLTNHKHDIPAAGFGILTVAQAMGFGFLATHDAGKEQFAAVTVIFIPGLILISFYNLMNVVLRILGFISAAAFTLLAFLLFLGKEITTDNILIINLAYIPMNIVLIGWAWYVYRQKL
jgi:hypothetical protein